MLSAGKNIKSPVRKVALMAGLALFIVGILCLSGAASAAHYGKEVSCRTNALCKSLEGKEFEMILFSEFGSELGVLYDKSSVGDIKIAISGSPYRMERGTVLDAIHFLTKTSEYRGFVLYKAGRSTGLFSSEVIDDMYIVKPLYSDAYPHDAAKYSLSEKDGQLELRIKPVYYLNDD